MSEQSPFDRQNIENSAAVQTTGLLEQLNVPPAAAAYIRRNQRMIWTVVIGIALVVAGVSLYGSYRNYRENKASEALALAMEAEGDAKKSQLAEVVDEYGATGAGTWSRIKLAQIAASEGDLPKAISGLEDLKKSLSAKNPVMPLLAYNLAVLHEKNNELNKAMAAYNELLTYQGFEGITYKAMGRIYEAQGSKDKALEVYNKYIELGDTAGQPFADPDRSMIQTKINNLTD